MSSQIASDTKSSSKQRYGMLSMIAMIVGTVMGSGIYVKNDSLMQTSNSAILSLSGWIVGGLIVGAMLIAFIEISSITSIKKEQGTFTNWGRHLWGEKFSKFIGGYFLFIYFPLVIMSESIFASEQLFQTDLTQTFFSPWVGFMIITLISFLFVIGGFILNSIFVKTGKIAQLTGTIIKTIPLFLVVFLAVVILFGVSAGGAIDTTGPNNVFDPNGGVNVGITEGANKSSIRVLLMLPAILFAFDGFLFASSLSNETKSKNTYRNAAIISIFIITFIYISFSLSTFFLSDGTAFSINGIIEHVFNESVASVLSPIISVVISLSIITSLLGYTITSMWTMSDKSVDNEVVDKNGTLIKRNKSGVPSGAGFRMLVISLIGVFVVRVFDLIAFAVLLYQTPGEVSYQYVGMTDFVSNLFTVMDFVFYAIIIVGGLMNRSTKKVEVEKTSGFIISGIFATLAMIIIVLFSLTSIFNGLIDSFSSGDSQVIIPVLQIVAIITFFGVYIGTILMVESNVEKQSEEVWENKKVYIEAYKEHKSFKEFIEEHDEYKENDYVLSSYEETVILRIKNQWDKFINLFRKED